ncbi:hypothetical protein [Cloacibacillus evryensis]|uniref:hypothetical protein n=1 Tax=Cloacibacillus evryensis TaxID=508460 RepID=UPI002B205C9C|nr:hypothetical protein [Cloacibacillus evryensis]MEA5034212.1 hypothetical protein [Cloacibacillus evryensis]
MKKAKIIKIGGHDFRPEGTAKGFRCTHHLFRSVAGGYLVSYTNLEDIKESGRKAWMR